MAGEWELVKKGANTVIKENEFVIGLGWDPKPSHQTGSKIDLDAGVFMVKKNGKIASKTDLIYFGNLKSNCKSVIHMGDNLTGEGDGDDEQVYVDVSRVPDTVDKLIVVVQIYEASTRKRVFGFVENCYARLFVPQPVRPGKKCEVETKLIHFDLVEEYGDSTGVVFCEIYRYEGKWKFRAVGKGFNGGFTEMLNILK
jgi:tellurium resistance protein TerD